MIGPDLYLQYGQLAGAHIRIPPARTELYQSDHPIALRVTVRLGILVCILRQDPNS